MYESQHRLDLQDNVGFGGDPAGEDHNLSRSRRRDLSAFSNTAANNSGNVDPYLFNDLVEMIPLVHSYIEQNAKSSFTRRGSMAYTKTPSRESLYKKAGEAKGRHAGQSIPVRKRREDGEKDRVNNDADSFSFLQSRGLMTEKEREELAALREQVEDLQRILLEKDELLKSAEASKDQLTSVQAKIDELKKQSLEKDSVLKSTQLQLSDTKIKLADKQAAIEKLQWESMTSNKKVEQLQEDLDTLQDEMSAFMMLFEGLSKNDKITQSTTEDYDIKMYYSDMDDFDEKEMERIEEAEAAYTTAIANAKDKQDEESMMKAASARSLLQSFLLRPPH